LARVIRQRRQRLKDGGGIIPTPDVAGKRVEAQATPTPLKPIRSGRDALEGWIGCARSGVTVGAGLLQSGCCTATFSDIPRFLADGEIPWKSPLQS
jgi:hypothetical protein